MANVWFFGDSYCACNSNWVKQISKNLNANVANLGIPGSSIGFLLDDLLRKHEDISSDDTVIVCVTDSNREYFPPAHLQPWAISSMERGEAINWINYCINLSGGSSNPNPRLQAEHIYEAYREYIKFLFDEHHTTTKNHAIFSHIYNTILPSLATNKVLVLFSIGSTEYIKYPFLNTYSEDLNTDSLWFFCGNYLTTNKLVNSWDEAVEYVRILENHWIDTPEYEYAFWNKFNPYFEKIGAATSIKPKLR